MKRTRIDTLETIREALIDILDELRAIDSPVAMMIIAGAQAAVHEEIRLLKMQHNEQDR